MRYAKISLYDTANGPGIRTVLWVQGCTHRCKGCHNPGTWDSKGGEEFTVREKISIIKSLEPDYIKGITYSGGDPLYEGNRGEISCLIEYIHNIYPTKSQWLYTGYRWEEIKDLNFIKYLDVVVDGEYVEDERDISLDFRGSRNQRLVDVRESLKRNKVILWRNI